MRTSALSMCTAGLVVATLAGQTQDRQSVERPVAIAGRVVRASDGAPLPNVRISASDGSGELGRVATRSDADGEFTLLVRSGQVRLAARKTGYSTLTLDATPGTPVAIQLVPSVVVSGRVIDDRGDPVVGALVVAEEATAAGVRAPVLARAETDDLGEYRLSGLPAKSRFVVSALTIGTTNARDPQNPFVSLGPQPHRTFYFNAAERSEAHVLTVSSGEQIPSVDFVVPLNRSGYQLFSVYRQLPVVPPALAMRPRPVEPEVGRIHGYVRSTDGMALARAKVLLVSTTGQPIAMRDSRVVEAEVDGSFTSPELPAGTYHVRASKPGFSEIGATTDVSVLSSSATGRRVTVAANQRISVDVRLARWGTISGTVRDEYGDPIQGASVQLSAVRYQRGRRQLVVVSPTPSITDDRGSYRLFAVPPGAFVIGASVNDVRAADWPGYAPSYFPGTAFAGEARSVRLELSGQLTNVDIDLVPTRTYRVAGSMRNAAGMPTMGGAVRLVTSQRSGAAVAVTFDARVSEGGHFEFPNVVPGQFVVQIQPGRRTGSDEGEFGSLPVTVADSDVTNLQVQATAGSSVLGRIVLEGAPPAGWSATSLALRAIPTDLDQSPSSGWATADIAPGGTFALAGLHGPRRLTVSGLPPGWTLRAVRVGGVDVTDQPLAFGRKEDSLVGVQVMLTDRATSVRGTVIDAGRRPVAHGHAVIFAADRDRWYPQSRYVGTAPVNADGTFHIEGVPAGSFYVAAVSTLPEGDEAWQDPEWLDALTRYVVSVPLGDGEQRTLSPLTIADVP